MDRTLNEIVSDSVVIVSGDVFVIDEIEVVTETSVRTYQRVRLDVGITWKVESARSLEFVTEYDFNQAFGTYLTTGDSILVSLQAWNQSGDLWPEVPLYLGPCDLYVPLAYSNWVSDLPSRLSAITEVFTQLPDAVEDIKLAHNWTYRPAWGAIWTYYGDWQLSQYLGWYWIGDYNSEGNIWIWSTELGWCWTASAFYPWMYRMDTDAWIWVRSNATQLTLDGLCSVYDYGTNSWLEFTIGDFWWYLN